MQVHAAQTIRVDSPVGTQANVLEGYPDVFDIDNLTERHSKVINPDQLAKGITQYNKLKGRMGRGIEIIDHQVVPESTLKFQRQLKMGANGGAIAFNALSALGLFYSGSKLFLSSFGAGDVDDSYKSLGNAYSASALAGALTGAAHESPEWSIGNIGMGFFSRYLQSIWGLAGFSLSEGFSAVGMGKVRYRDEKNAYAVKNSLFNKPGLEAFKPLIPIEQSIINFAKRFTSVSGWKKFSTEEPYSLFQAAGGGLISGGGILGVASIFKNKMSERLQNFFYLPYSASSIMNLIAFYRDGQVQIKRSKQLGSRKQGEQFSMSAEGYLRMASAPILAVNNLLLGLKGLGIDSQGGIMYNLAMSTRAFGAGLAFLSFKAQSMIKFFKPDMFGPTKKEVFRIKLDPNKQYAEIKEHLDEVELNKPPPHESDTFKAILYDGDNNVRELIDRLLQTQTMQSMKNKTQIGLPTPIQPGEGGRYYLERYNHSIRVAAVGHIIYEGLLNNTEDEDLRKYLLDNEDAFKLSGLLHDVGHIARSHLAEQAVRGHDNDENTLDILEDGNSDVCQTIKKYYQEKGEEGKGEKVIKQARDIIGRHSPLYKAFKICDYTEYLRYGDFSCTDGFPLWKLDDAKEYADTVRLFKDGKDSKGKDIIRTGFTERGAIISFLNIFDRKAYNDTYNDYPVQRANEMTYLLGLDAADVSTDIAKKMTEEQMDAKTKEGLDKLKGSTFDFRIKNMTGGETAYCGYAKDDPEKKIYVVFDDGRKPMEFIDYVEKHVKSDDPELYAFLAPRIKNMTVAKEIDLYITVGT